MGILRITVTRCSGTVLKQSQFRAYSAIPSLVTSESFEAPHCGTIKVLKLNRPEARNAISKGLLADLQSEVANLDLFPLNGQSNSPSAVRALIITSAVNNVFCAGADLKERVTFTLDESVPDPYENLRC
jgi:methylglutaconyl-CoA hydratase